MVRIGGLLQLERATSVLGFDKPSLRLASGRRRRAACEHNELAECGVGIWRGIHTRRDIRTLRSARRFRNTMRTAPTTRRERRRAPWPPRIAQRCVGERIVVLVIAIVIVVAAAPSTSAATAAPSAS